MDWLTNCRSVKLTRFFIHENQWVTASHAPSDHYMSCSCFLCFVDDVSSASFLVMDESCIPIDIHANKLLGKIWSNDSGYSITWSVITDWLVSRRHCNKDWVKSLTSIRQMIVKAMQDMPEHEEIARILSSGQRMFALSVINVSLIAFWKMQNWTTTRAKR